jgi:hypothetical protein
MATVTFPVALGGDGNTYTDDKDPSTGLDGGGHRTRFVPILSQTVAMAQTAKDKADAAAASQAAAASSATAAASSQTAAAASAAAAATSQSAANASATAAATSASNAASSQASASSSQSAAAASASASAASAASALIDADRAEAAIQGLLGRRTVVTTSAENLTVADGDSNTHYRCTRSTRAEVRLPDTVSLGATMHFQKRAAGLIHFVQAQAGGTIRSRGGRRHLTELDGQVTAVKTGATEWSLSGDLGDVVTTTANYQLANGTNLDLVGGGTYQTTRITAAP